MKKIKFLQSNKQSYLIINVYLLLIVLFFRLFLINIAIQW